MHKFLTVFFIFLGLVQVQAQQTKSSNKITGVIKDSITLTAISGVVVNDRNRKNSTYSGENGVFNIMANIGDTLDYYAPSFHNGYVVIAQNKFRMDTIEIWLRPKIREELPGVFVSTYLYKDYQADSASRMREFAEEVGFKTATFSKSSSGAGVGIGLDALFSKKNKQKKEAYKIFKDDEQQRYVDFRFNKILVHSYSGLTGNRLQEFMHKYRPSYAWLRDNADGEALKYYVNDKLKLYFLHAKD